VGQKDDKKETNIGSIFNGLGKLIDIISDMAEKGEDVKQFEGSIRQLDNRRNIKGRYNLKLNIGGIDKITDFADREKKQSGAELITPKTEVYKEGKDLTIVIELHGIDEKDIVVEIEDDTFILFAKKGSQKYYKSIDLEEKYKICSSRLNNGFLIVKMKEMSPDG